MKSWLKCGWQDEVFGKVAWSGNLTKTDLLEEFKGICFPIIAFLQRLTGNWPGTGLLAAI
jgi:hypothetical protein